LRQRERYDVVVAGGGTAGALAGIAASQAGAKTLVVERYGSLGGALSLGFPLLGSIDGDGEWALGGIGRALVERLMRQGGATPASVDPQFGSVLGQDPELLKIELLQMAVEAGVGLLFHTTVVDAVTTGARVTGLLVANKAGLEIIPAEVVVDCTSDADVVAAAGGAFTLGRRGDGLTQPASRIFRVDGVDLEQTWNYLAEHAEDRAAPEGWTGEDYSIDHLRATPGAAVEGFASLVRRARAAGDWTIPRDRFGINTLPGRGDVTVNASRVHGVDGTNPDSVTAAEVEATLQVGQALRFLRKYVPGFQHARIVSAPYQLGVRETRHIQGRYELTRDDVLSGRDFPDQIGRGAYPLDIHDPKPEAIVLGHTVHGGGVTLWRIMRSFGIPVGCLIPQGLDNIAVGGRCISATHEAAGSIRGQASCMVTGHAAGALAALAARRGLRCGDVPVDTLQALLRQQGGVLERGQRVPT